MPTYTIYADTNDHTVRSDDATYANARAGSGSKADLTSTTFIIGQNPPGSVYQVWQSFAQFDLSGVPADPPISLTLSLTTSGAGVQGNFQMDVGEYAWSGGTGDFRAGTALSALTKFGTRSMVNGSSGVLSTTGLINPTRSAAYKLMLWSHNQETGSSPSGVEFVQFNSANATGTTDDPKITMVMPTPPGTATETDTAFALAATLMATTGLAEEVDTALALTATVTLPTDLAIETDEAFALNAILPPPVSRTATLPAASTAARVVAF